VFKAAAAGDGVELEKAMSPAPLSEQAVQMAEGNRVAVADVARIGLRR
jgi:hypothetical protein